MDFFELGEKYIFCLSVACLLCNLFLKRTYMELERT